MKIQALDIQIGNRIMAYCNHRRQACTVKQVINSGLGSIELTVCPSEHARISLSRVIRFHPDATVDLAS